jgi:hypothetical protein
MWVMKVMIPNPFLNPLPFNFESSYNYKLYSVLYSSYDKSGI